MEDAADFLDPGGMLIGTVSGRNDLLRDGLVEMGTPVGNNAVGTVFKRAAASAVSDNGVDGNVAMERQIEDGEEQRRIGTQEANAIGGSNQSASHVVPDGLHHQLSVFFAQERRHADEIGEESGDGAQRYGAAPVGRGDKNNAGDIATWREENNLLDLCAGFRRQIEFLEMLIGELPPEGFAALADEEAGNKTAHAVPDENFLPQMSRAFASEFLIESHEFGPEDGGGFPDRQAGRVKIEPELIAVADDGIGEEAIESLNPRGGAGHEPMHKDDGDFVRIVGLELEEPGVLDVLLGEKEGIEINEPVFSASDEEGEGGGFVRSKRKGTSRAGHVADA